MKNKIPNAMGINLNELESNTNFNQSYNETPRQQRFPSESKKSFFETLKTLSLTTINFLIVCPILFILIGIIYRNSCHAKPNLPLFLIIFGLLILVNLLIYTIVGATFLALIRRSRSFTLEKGVGIFLATLLGIIFGIIIFIWWIMGTIWWIKLTLSLHPQLRYPTSLALCHPVVYWTALVANIFGLIGFIVQICIAIGGGLTASKQ